MQSLKHTLPFFFFLFVAWNGLAQPAGNWTVKQVSVGDEIMTPTAKWFNLKEDGTFTSGNGGIRNLMGTWEYDAASTSLLYTDSYGVEDPAGPFTVQLINGEMFWLRTEGGMNVVVQLVPSKGNLTAPWDLLYGYWEEETGTSNILLRWDNIYILREEGSRSTGGWVMHSHRHDLLIFPGDPEGPAQRWEVTFIDDRTMEWSNGEETRRFLRRPMD
jgi:hypothetical protein